jgi:DNA (cytosine-5)-methyltransferase 1
MNYLSVCSGVEAATVAWHDLGWKPVGFSEIEKFPSEVLQHHYPQVTNYGDMTKYKEWNINEPVELLVGGTPCQSFSVAGLRKGLEDPRGNLALVFCGMLDHFRPKWFVWENVPGVLSSSGGRDFGSFLGAVAELGYGFSYRVLDAQYFGVPQRRRRVFVVGHLGDWRPTTQVLFESSCLRRDNPPSRKKKQNVTGFTTDSFGGDRKEGSEKLVTFDKQSNCEYSTNPIASTINARDYKSATDLIVYENHAQDSRVKEVTVSPTVAAKWGTGGGNVPIAIQGNLIGRDKGGPQGIGVSEGKPMYTLTKTDIHGVSTNMTVRRLTPVECERLQGFPDNYTNIKDKCPDGHRYKAMGNSMAVPVMRWIGERIHQENK